MAKAAYPLNSKGSMLVPSNPVNRYWKLKEQSSRKANEYLIPSIVVLVAAVFVGLSLLNQQLLGTPSSLVFADFPVSLALLASTWLNLWLGKAYPQSGLAWSGVTAIALGTLCW